MQRLNYLGIWRHPCLKVQFSHSLRQKATLVNEKAAMRKKDFWIERYIFWLADRVSPANPQLTEAKRAYGQFQQTGDERQRHEAWQHLHAAADEVGRRRAPRRREVAS